MSSIYYPESWMQHPEVLRLQQRVRELEKENQELKQMYVEGSTAHFWKAEFEHVLKDYRMQTDKRVKLMKECFKFNKLSFIRKAFYRFHTLDTFECESKYKIPSFKKPEEE